MTKTPLARWLNARFLEWQLQEGERKNLTQFAEYLGMSQAYLSMCITGVRESVSQEMAERIARRLGDEIYVLLGKQAPDPVYSYVTRNWERLSPEQQRQVKDEVARYLTQESEPASHNP